MPISSVLKDLREYPHAPGGRVRLATIVRLRWVAILGQLVAIGFVSLILGFDVPLAYTLSLIALSAWINVFLAIQHPGRHRLPTHWAAALLVYDILQLSGLLYLTGGIGNPFVILLLAPVTVSAATLPPIHTIVIGATALVSAYLLTYFYWPLPWYEGMRQELPVLYKYGVFAAVGSSMVFIALYVRRLAKESRDMATALTATELILAREQKLHALDGLAAAAAHELGTPLSTIVLITKELERDIGPDHPQIEDVRILRAQADRCREILRKLTRKPTEPDPLHASVSLRELLDEAATPYMDSGKIVSITSAPSDSADEAARREPVGSRQPGVIFGIGNIIENAVDFARTRVDVTARWDADRVVVEIIDDGPGFPPDLMDALGDPYVTTRGSATSRRDGKEASGLGLGFFIAKTLLERSGATVELENRIGRPTGAIVRLIWPRNAFVAAFDWPPYPT